MDIQIIEGGATLDRVTELLRAALEFDGHDAIGEHKWLDLVHGGKHDVVGIVAQDETLKGYAHLSRNGDQWGLEIVVDPNHRGVGIELELARAAIENCAALGGGHLHWWTFRPSEIHETVAHELKMRRGRTLHHLVLSLPVASQPSWPPEIEVRAFDPSRDIDAWITTNRRAFGRHPEQGAWTKDIFERRMKEPWFDPAGIAMVWQSTELKGFCWTKTTQNTGEIYVIAVDPSMQGKGLGKALTLNGCHWAHARSKSKMTLYVDADNTQAASLYQKLGFEMDHFDRAYVLDVKSKTNPQPLEK